MLKNEIIFQKKIFLGNLNLKTDLKMWIMYLSFFFFSTLTPALYLNHFNCFKIEI